MIYVVLIIYLSLTFLVSLKGVKTKDATPESYFLADRNLGTISLFFTILATNFSAFYFLGFAGEGYRVGYSVYIIMGLGTAFAGLAFLIIGTKVWSLGQLKKYITPAELVYGETKSRGLSYLFSATMIIFTLPYLALQIIGGGYLMENLTEGQVSYNLAVVLLTFVTIIYVVIGGMQSVAKTDLKQGLLVITFMFLAVIFIGGDLGGIAHANLEAYNLKPDLFSIEGEGDFYQPKKWFSMLVLWFFCVPMFPQLFMRFYIAKDLPTLKRSALLYAFIPLLISILPVMLGVWGHISFPDLVGKESDQILPMMLVEHSSPIFYALVMVAAIAAFMSTLDSQLLALSTMMTRDFYIPLAKKAVGLKREVFVGRVFVAILAFVGMLIAFVPFATIFDMGKMAFSGLAILFPVSLAITKWKYFDPSSGVISIVVGLFLLFGFYYDILPQVLCLGFEPFIFILLVCFILVGLGSWFARRN